MTISAEAGRSVMQAPESLRRVGLEYRAGQKTTNCHTAAGRSAAAKPLSRTGPPDGRGAGVRATAAGQKAEQAPPRRAVPHPVALRATRPLPFRSVKKSLTA